MTIIERCRDYLEKAYRERLGLRFSSSICQLEAGRQPVWRFVSADDLTSEIEPDESAAAVLLDPEIGLLFYLVPFHRWTDMRKQILRTLNLRSRLVVSPGPESLDEADPRGSWRIALHWLVDVKESRTWMRQVAEVRKETSFSEDISLDAVFINARDSLEKQLDHHGFPRLLLTTREVFSQEQIEDVGRWASADDLVRQTLREFPLYFKKPEQRELAEDVVRAAEDFNESCKDVVAGPAAPRTFSRIEIENFRNLREVKLNLGDENVSVDVIYGPNGAGKSSLCEALSLVLFGSSPAYRTFVDRTREKDVSVTDRTGEYFKHYLTPIDEQAESSADFRPRIALDDQPPLIPDLVPASETSSADIAMAGTILHQDETLEFARMSAHELGSRILRGYSRLAEQVEEYVEQRVQEANTNRQDFLRTFGLSTSITRLETAFERIARREIDRILPGLPQPLVEWLDTVQLGAQLSWRWQDWGNESARKTLATRLSQMDESPDNLEAEICDWLDEFNELAAFSKELVKNIDERIGALRPELDQAAARIRAWGEWLGRGNRAVQSEPVTPKAETFLRDLELLQSEQQRVLEQGRDVARQIEHLTLAEAYVKEAWGKHHADQCPTCGADHAGDGGILAVVQSLLEQTTAERDRLRAEYVRLKLKIEEAQKALDSLGQNQCPLPPGEQARLGQAFRWLIPDGADFREWISEKSRREDLISVLLALKETPLVPLPVDARSEAARVTRELVWQFRDARKVFEAPGNWRPVKERLTTILADVVNQHLPRSLAALWLELCLNLTPAPWLLPDRPRIDVTCRRGEQRSTLQVKGRLARYILNQAEVHILGLAWFFTRYMTYGRFSHTCMIMDDPAHHLDESAFGDLCRLWQTLVRLHRVYSRPLKLIITLNQETRATLAARITGGTLSVLSWMPDQHGVPGTRLIKDDLCSFQPVRLFQKAAS
ncbi:MAG TPA: AAA family ATPase [Acidobacteriota bacterium]|nr:AAA family ATPase [Acidobacteriota bacterium]